MGSRDSRTTKTLLLWPVSDRATPPTEGLHFYRETFGRTFRRGQETLAELLGMSKTTKTQRYLRRAQHLFHQPSWCANIELMDSAGVQPSTQSHKPTLQSNKRACLIGPNRMLGGQTRIAVQAAGQIDR